MSIKKLLLLCSFSISLMFFPTIVSAVDFTIEQVEIDAYLQENGETFVEERHHYIFDGEFNGMTRTLTPQRNTDIINVEAFEEGSSLEVSMDEDLYKIYRGGEDESVHLTITYTIENGIDVYQDIAEFYWPFFDSSNESDYENLTITVHPPEETNEVIAFGYDEAFMKESTLDNGSVLFDFGFLPSGSKGDIRVAYNQELFESGLATDTLMKEKLLQEQNNNILAVERKAERKLFLENVSPVFFVVILAIACLFILLAVSYKKKNKMKMISLLQGSNSSLFNKLSLPATIYFSNYQQLHPEAVAASLLDLLRKGKIKEVGEKHFQLLSKEDTLPHERHLIDWLFNTIGNGTEFHVDQLTDYTKNEENHDSYNQSFTKWVQKVKEEVKSAQLINNRAKPRWFAGFVSISLLPLVVIYPIHDLILYFVLTLFSILFFMFFAIFYTAKSVNGEMLNHELEQFQQRFFEDEQNNWNNWEREDLKKAVIFNMGTKNKKFKQANDKLVQAFKASSNDFNSNYDPLQSFVYMAGITSLSFHNANQHVVSASSNSTSGSGTGAGGGGGGSGAF
ncbi:DUF2207 domain-containing protein [Alkalihalobacillus trypoxylicola]|uniref:DUF2207 domain-containing protein n=1 Tax=Alkalihalobacillus trypoxylicola TaxID=519424 RepID=A0A162F2C3_9BACI|nr:DUF2207 domain-containing protein [Alkalihalobacillus trypoxylicola]KYG34333.1 hypothetical protein AZF04_14160 [Alkalihalobacillus trypoxylicola]